MADDDQWQQLLDGDDAAWDAAVLTLFGRVRAFFVNKVGDKADELTQRTFRRLLEVRGSYRGGSPRAFAFGIAKFILLEYFRELRRDEVVPLEDVSAAAMDPRPSSVLVAEAQQRLVLEALRRLPLASQIVLELYYWEDMNDREIAEALEAIENTVRGRRTHAKTQLRRILQELEAGAAPSTTSMDFERWARSVREKVGLASPSSH